MADLLPGADDARRLLARHAPKDGVVAVVADGASADALDATARFAPARRVDAVDGLGKASVDGVLLLAPTRLGPLIPQMQAVHDALREGGVAVVLDVVWQTAPTPELARAFAPPPGREKVRPIEAFEMQVEHAGFVVVERVDVPREAWLALDAADPRRAAVEADARGALKAAAWALRRA